MLYAATDEWARNAEDVIRRRTTLFYRGFGDERVARKVEELLGRAAAECGSLGNRMGSPVEARDDDIR